VAVLQTRRAARRPSPTHLGFRVVLLVLTLLTAACGASTTTPTAAPAAPAPTTATAAVPAGAATAMPAAPANPIKVVAAENFWGSIAAQLGGNRVAMTAIITNPNTDPHDYEPTPADARTIATAQLVIVNGIGYDPWAPKLLAANPTNGRVVLTVGDLLGLKEGDNPHRWYSPTDVRRVIDQITADYQQIDPAGAAYYDAQRTSYLTKSLATYNELISTIKARYAGTPVGASESIFVPMAQALGLDLITPPGFMNAISEGTDLTAQDKATADAQIKNKQIKVYVFNSQNVTPDVQSEVNAAKAEGIPIATVTETLAPATATFQDWQVAQLQGLEAALARATGK
jgi:zinc/manganese transport system substrate-binding protein